MEKLENNFENLENKSEKLENNFENLEKSEENTTLEQIYQIKPTPGIVVIGVGGAGGNAVNNMIKKSLKGVDFIVANTDAQALARSKNAKVIHLGAKVTKGLGAGSDPEIGRIAAQESIKHIKDAVQGYNMAFITAGMGGGTGTGAAPVIANEIRQKGILTVAVVSKPFEFEGKKRSQIAQKGIEELQKNVDTILVIPNQNLFAIANEKTTLAQAFDLADQVLYSGVAGITDLMTKEGLINLDFADVCAIMNNKGKAMMGSATAEGQNRAKKAANQAIANPLLDKVSIKGAKGVLVSIMGARDKLTLYEIEQATNTIKEKIDENANIIFGAIFDEQLKDKISVSILATGMSDNNQTHFDNKQKINKMKNLNKNNNDENIIQNDEIQQNQNKKIYQIKQKNLQPQKITFREIKPHEIENKVEIKEKQKNNEQDKNEQNKKLNNEQQSNEQQNNERLNNAQQTNSITGMRKRIMKFFTDISELDEDKNIKNQILEDRKNIKNFDNTTNESKQKYNAKREPELPSFLRKQK